MKAAPPYGGLLAPGKLVDAEQSLPIHVGAGGPLDQSLNRVAAPLLVSENGVGAPDGEVVHDRRRRGSVEQRLDASERVREVVVLGDGDAGMLGWNGPSVTLRCNSNSDAASTAE